VCAGWYFGVGKNLNKNDHHTFHNCSCSPSRQRVSKVNPALLEYAEQRDWREEPGKPEQLEIGDTQERLEQRDRRGKLGRLTLEQLERREKFAST
jgi:hypothetical protein